MPSIKGMIREWEAKLGDLILGISTLGTRRGDYPELESEHGDSFWYESKSYYLNWLYLRPLRLEKKDVVYDIGCGAGRLLIVASLCGVARCVGLELSQRLCELAKKNAENLRLPHAPLVIEQADACTRDYTDGNIFLFCNPFGPATLEVVLEKIRQSLEMRPRLIRIMYIHPEPGHRELFSRLDWMELKLERTFPGGRGIPAMYFEMSSPD